MCQNLVLVILLIIQISGIPNPQVNPKLIKSFTKLNLSLDNQINLDTSYSIKTITNVPLFRIVNYFTNQTEQSEVKVHDLALPHEMYYTHMYLAWLNADKFLSSVIVLLNFLNVN